MPLNYEQRLEIFRQVVNNPDLTLSAAETLAHTYHFVRAEVLSYKIEKLQRIRRKHLDILNQDVRVYNLRMEMKDL